MEQINLQAEPTNKFRVKCTKCDEVICSSSTLNKLFARMLELTDRHNGDVLNTELCEGSKEELSMDDLRSGFSSSHFQIEAATYYELEASQHQPAEKVFGVNE